MGRLQPPAQLGGRDHFGAPDALLPAEPGPAIPEHDQEQPDQAGAGQRAEPGAGEHLGLDPLARLQRRDRGGDVADAQHVPRAVGETHLLARIGIVAEVSLISARVTILAAYHSAPVVLRHSVPGRHGHGHEGREQHGGLEELAPHADAVEDGLAAPERAAADTAHIGLLFLA